MTRRMLTALVALVGLFVATYLALYKAGVIGVLACGTGGCETVQLSKWATLGPFSVAMWGVAYYALVFALTFAATTERWAQSDRLALGLLVLTGWGVAFSAWLTYLELFVIRAICRYCVVSAAIAVLLFVLVLLDWRQLKTQNFRTDP
jgi:uncharacterized membrane protein